jgi:hypothetical protein
MRAGSALLKARNATSASPSDTGTAIAASTTPSSSNCQITRARVAPIARRSAISRWRSAPRASSRFMTFAPPIASTSSAPI